MIHVLADKKNDCENKFQREMTEKLFSTWLTRMYKFYLNEGMRNLEAIK